LPDTDMGVAEFLVHPEEAVQVMHASVIRCSMNDDARLP
jgi:hypothetical protein